MTISEMTWMAEMIGITGMTCMIRMTINEMTWMAEMTGMTRTTSMTRMNRLT